MNVFRAVMITGPPGIGKTSTAHLVAKLEGFTPIEVNASDARSKRLIEAGVNIANRSLDGWMAGGEGSLRWRTRARELIKRVSPPASWHPAPKMKFCGCDTPLIFSNLTHNHSRY